MIKTAFCTIVIILALLVVGLVSNTLVRHLIQVIPLTIPLLFIFYKRQWIFLVSVPLMALWLLVMIFIWLFLLKIARIVHGHFSPTEIAMTILIGVFCLYGIFTALKKMNIPLKGAIVFLLFNFISCIVLMFTLDNIIHTHQHILLTITESLTGLVGMTLLVRYLLQKTNYSYNYAQAFSVLLLLILQTSAFLFSSML